MQVFLYANDGILLFLLFLDKLKSEISYHFNNPNNLHPFLCK